MMDVFSIDLETGVIGICQRIANSITWKFQEEKKFFLLNNTVLFTHKDWYESKKRHSYFYFSGRLLPVAL